LKQSTTRGKTGMSKGKTRRSDSTRKRDHYGKKKERRYVKILEKGTLGLGNNYP